MAVHDTKESFNAYMRERRKTRPDRRDGCKKYKEYINNKIKENARAIEISKLYLDAIQYGHVITDAHICRKKPAPGAE